jgi:hypothetical protein
MAQHPLPPGQKYGDILGFNDYRIYNDNYWELYYPGKGIAAKAEAIRQKMRGYGLDFPLMGTEVSTYASGLGIPVEEQARDAAKMYIRGLVSGLITVDWWTFADFPDSCSNPPDCKWWKFGLVDENLVPKPAYWAYATVAQQLSGYWYERTLNIPGIEGYVFKNGSLEKQVVLSLSDQTVPVVFTAHHLHVVDMYGNPSDLYDGGTGTITLQVWIKPLYVQVDP